MNLPITPEMIPILLTFAGIAILTVGVLYIGFTSTPIKSATGGSKKKEGGIPADFRKQFLDAYNKVFSTYNMQPMNDMLTDFTFYTTKNTVKVLEKLGIKKEVDIKINEKQKQFNEGLSNYGFVMQDGKNDMTIDILKCDYTETYSDAQTNKKIYKRVFKNAAYNLEFLKTNEKLNKDITHCMNCGDTLKRNGNFFECESCGTHYESENLKWSASNVSVEPDSNKASGLILAGIIGLVFLGVIEMFIKNVTFGFILGGINAVLIAGIVLYLRWAWNAACLFKKMVANDPKASRMVFAKRVYYLIRTLEMARDFDLNMIKPFMTPELYEKIKQNNNYDDYYVVDLIFKQIIPTDYRIEGQNQIIEFDIKYNQLLMNPKKKIKETKVKRHYALYKSVNAMTKVNASAQAVICPSCGASINVTTEGICSFCNASYSVSDFDWVFYDAPIEMTK